MCDLPPVKENKPPLLRRNGLDYVPPKTYPPDYSNVPDVRDWQMSPFPKERFDLNELQVQEKKGEKGRKQLEALRASQAQAQAEKSKESNTCKRCLEQQRCNQPEVERYLYQPYGPSPLPVMQPQFQKRSQRLTEPYSNNETPCNSWVVGYDYIPYGPTANVRTTPEFYKPYGPSTLRTVFAHLY